VFFDSHLEHAVVACGVDRRVRGVAKALAAARVQRVGTRDSADHLETQAGKAGLQLARDLLE
jgi:hypothetical protein